MRKNIERIKAASPAIRKEIEIKWNNSKTCEGQAWPLAEPAETTVDEATGEIVEEPPITTEFEQDEHQPTAEMEKNTARLNYLDAMRTYKNELELTRYQGVLRLTNPEKVYESMNDVEPEKTKEILEAMSSELDAQNAS